MFTKLIAIGGVDRSGTTLLASLLYKEFELSVTRESQWKTNKLFGLPPSDEDRFRFNLWSRGARIDLDQEFHEILNLYAAEHNLDSNLWLDHTPSNFKLYPLLADYFDEVVMVHVIRDPRAVVSSLLSTDWGISSVANACDFYRQS